MPKVHTPRSRQRGAVAIMTGLTAVVLFAFGGLVLDLGHLYIAKSELQNASDAAALAGAKELNNKLSGVTAAVNRAIATAAQHRYDFKKPVNITIANIRLATCPNPGNVNTWSRPGVRSPTCTFIPAASVTSERVFSGKRAGSSAAGCRPAALTSAGHAPPFNAAQVHAATAGAVLMP